MTAQGDCRIKGIIRIDSYYLRVQQLLKDHVPMREDLERRLAYLRHDLADVPASVCLRPHPMDVQIIPGRPDAEGKLWSNIHQIHKEQRACKAEIRRVEGEIREIERLIAKVMRLDGQPGRVLRGLYIDKDRSTNPPRRLTWEQVEVLTGICKSEMSRYRNIGVKQLADRLYSKIKTDFANPN